MDNDPQQAYNPAQAFVDLQHRLEEAEKRLSLTTGERDALSQEIDDLARFLSHDVRAPLRGIDGYSTALIEDYKDKLDPMGMAYLGYIADAGRQTSYLLDRLIYFIRLRHANMQIQTLNLNQIATDLILGLKKSQPERVVSWEISPDLIAAGDFKMMRELISMLLENAWKFTAKHASARIEVGQIQSDSQVVFFVRDDGAGFNMDYQHQLFRPFQRLHSGHEFDGAGMGLAIAQRIIERHHGRIWGEGKIDQGATFYFTIEEKVI